MAVGLAPGFPLPFGDYLLLSSFGRGGMGEVFLARRTALEGISRLCVIKTLRQDIAGDPEYVRRFLDEARVVMHLHHGNVCQTFDAGKVDETYFLAMEYISGANLRDLQRHLATSRLTLEPGVALHIASEVLDALAYSHRLRHPMTGEALHVIHRDVSPHNVMVSFEGEVKLIDFGLAQSSLKEEETASQIVLGKVGYMSPEQARGEEVDPTCDQFAAAVMTYELVVGDRFYGELPSPEVWALVGQGTWRPPRLAELDLELQSMLLRAWAPHPRDRFPSCEAMKETLDDYRAVRFPRIGKRQTRLLMQSSYGEHILREQQFLASVAEVSSPRLTAHSTSSPSASVAEALPPALGRVEATESVTRSVDSTELSLPPERGPPTTPATDAVTSPIRTGGPEGRVASLLTETSASTSLSRQERAFQAAADVERSASSSIGLDDPPRPGRGLVWAAAAGVALVAGGLLALRAGEATAPPDPTPDRSLIVNAGQTPPTEDGDPPAVDPPPLDERPAAEPDPANLGPPSDGEGRPARRRRTSAPRTPHPPAAPTGEDAPPMKEAPPPAERVPPPARVEPEKAPPPKPEAPPNLTVAEMLKEIDRCPANVACRRQIDLLKAAGNFRPQEPGSARALRQCAYTCLGWRRDAKGNWHR